MVSRPNHDIRTGRIRFVPLLLGNMSVVETHNCVSTEVVFGRKKTVIGRNEARLTERERSNPVSSSLCPSALETQLCVSTFFIVTGRSVPLRPTEWKRLASVSFRKRDACMVQDEARRFDQYGNDMDYLLSSFFF